MKLSKHARNLTIIAEISIILASKPDKYVHTEDKDENDCVNWNDNLVSYMFDRFIYIVNHFAVSHTQLCALHGISKLYDLAISDYEEGLWEDYDFVDSPSIKKKHLHILNLIADLSIVLDKVPLMGKLEKEPKEIEHQACWYMFECNVIIDTKDDMLIIANTSALDIETLDKIEDTANTYGLGLDATASIDSSF